MATPRAVQRVTECMCKGTQVGAVNTAIVLDKGSPGYLDKDTLAKWYYFQHYIVRKESDSGAHYNLLTTTMETMRHYMDVLYWLSKLTANINWLPTQTASSSLDLQVNHKLMQVHHVSGA